MGILSASGYRTVNHYAPLHYLPFIARCGSLLSKPELRARGYAESHFRSKSKHHDEDRGFGIYVHATLHPSPPILLAKLHGGFPHVRIEIPVAVIDEHAYDLCRFNVAMTRKLRRNGSKGHAESSENGRYYDHLQVPIARTEADKSSMLAAAKSNKWMIEVLVPRQILLPDAVRVHCFSDNDVELASQIIRVAGKNWDVLRDNVGYPENEEHANSVSRFVTNAIRDPAWKGDGLEYDKV